MDSNHIKTALYNYFRFKKGCYYLATEVGYFNSDFLAVSKKGLIEIEVKTSKSDFKADFKKEKHKIYETGTSPWTPTFFYFAVPEELASFAAGKLAGTKYGILVINEATLIETKRHRISKNRETIDESFEYLKDIFKDRWVDGNLVTTENEEFIEYKVRSFRPYDDCVKVVKRATPMKAPAVSPRVLDKIVARMSSELANLRVKRIISESK
jgi:hypothetical protein